MLKYWTYRSERVWDMLGCAVCPGGHGKEIIRGFEGIQYSQTGARTDSIINGFKTFYDSFFNRNTAIAAGHNKVIRIRF